MRSCVSGRCARSRTSSFVRRARRANGVPPEQALAVAATVRGRGQAVGMRFAFYGRVSTDDAQDPSLSIPRQLVACEHAAAAAGGEVVACYWDVESGRKDLEQRG